MKKSLLLPLFLLSCFIFTSCGNSVVKMKLPIYSIDELNSNRPEFTMYRILTPAKYDAAQLSLIVSDIRKNTDIKYTGLWISFYVKEGDNTPYAESFISAEEAYTKVKAKEKNEPDSLPVTEAYTEPEAEKTPAVTSKLASSVNGEIEGKFYDQFGVYTIYKSNNTYYMDNKFSDGSSSKQVLETKTRNNKRTFNVVGDPYEFFLIKNGDLYIYDNEGNLGLVYKGL